ncbi:MAG: sortase [Anaerolineales bacterium]
MIFSVFVSLAASAIYIKPVDAAQGLGISTASDTNSISGFETGLNSLGKDIKLQQACTNDTYEPDNNYSQAKIISTDGIPQSHINTPSTEEDWVKFNAVVGHHYDIRTRLTNDVNESDTAANDTLLYLYNTDGVTVLASNDDVGYATWYNGYYFYRESLISWTALSTGVYYVRELQWGPTAGYTIRDCHTYNLWVVDLTVIPQLTLLKTSTTASITSAGQVVPYTYQLINTTNITLTGVSLSDDHTTPTCPPVSTLMVGDSIECTSNYSVTQADMDHGGSLTNTATAGFDQGSDITAQLNIPILQTPAIKVVKNSLTASVDHAGQVVPYTFVVTNTGNVTLTGISVSDPNCSSSPAYQAGDTNNDGKLDLLEAWTYTCSHTVTQPEVDAGGNLNNTVTASSNEAVGVTATLDIPISQSPALGIEKSVTETGYSTVGTVLHYSYKVTNLGNVSLSGPYTVTDDRATDEACPVTPTLAPGSFIICTASYTITLGDLDSGSVTNIASAHGLFGGSPVDSATDTKTIYATQITSLALTKTGTLNMNVVAPNGVANMGDTITYTFLLHNTGNVTLTDLSVGDPRLPVLTCTIASLPPGVSTSCAASNNEYILTQADIDAGSVSNTAVASGKDPNDIDVTGSDSITVNIPQSPVIGVAKRMLGNPVLVSSGTWDVTFEFLLKNYGDVSLDALQVTDDLTLTFPTPTIFTVLSVTSPSFSVNWSTPVAPTDYDGVGNLNLLSGGDILAVGGQGAITLVVRIVPASTGPFNNSAIASGLPPSGPRVMDVSSDGTDPDHTINCSEEDSCINDDGNPNNNTKLTPVIFSENLFDPPFGIKSVDSSGLPGLSWTMVWINGSNIVAQNAAVSDPIPVGTTYVAGSLSCTGASALTTTTVCSYEIPSVPYPLGRVIWTGTIGPDLGATAAASAHNGLKIAFKITVNSGVKSVRNTATIDADLNGDGDTTDPGEQQVAFASSSWAKPPNPPQPTPAPPLYGFIIPETGFAPDRVTALPSQTTFYPELGDLWLEIPRLGVQMPIVGVPQVNGKWDVSWLGNDAGWLNGSAYPTWNGNSVLTGHVTDATGEPGPFAKLNTLWWGDKVIIHASGAQYIYEVRSVQQSSPGNSAAMMKHEDLPWVTLVTCRAYNVSSNSYLYRILVRAVLVEVK